MHILASLIGQLAAWLSRTLRRGGGSTIGGVVAIRLDPDLITHLSERLDHGSLLCSATNGKTTTTGLIASAARALGLTVVTNSEGANLESGVASALIFGSRSADLAVFEVDEAALGSIASTARPRVVVLMNLFRDQLDRHGELATIRTRWQDMAKTLAATNRPPTLVLCADDPSLEEVGVDYPSVVWFGLETTAHRYDAPAETADATHCIRCGHRLDQPATFVGHLGHWNCPNCLSSRPSPDVRAREIVLLPNGGQVMQVELVLPKARHPDMGEVFEVTSKLTGLHNSYNLLAAFAALYAVKSELLDHSGHDTATWDPVIESFAAASPAFGRGEVIEHQDKTIRILLAKNPTGVNQNIRTLLRTERMVHVLILLNDRTADGHDVSWIWDVDWEPLVDQVRSITLGGDRCLDLAVRFKYGTACAGPLDIVAGSVAGLDRALSKVGPNEELVVLATYTAMLEVRQLLSKRGLARPFWEQAS